MPCLQEPPEKIDPTPVLHPPPPHSEAADDGLYRSSLPDHLDDSATRRRVGPILYPSVIRTTDINGDAATALGELLSNFEPAIFWYVTRTSVQDVQLIHDYSTKKRPSMTAARKFESHKPSAGNSFCGKTGKIAIYIS